MLSFAVGCVNSCMGLQCKRQTVASLSVAAALLYMRAHVPPLETTQLTVGCACHSRTWLHLGAAYKQMKPQSGGGVLEHHNPSRRSARCWVTAAVGIRAPWAPSLPHYDRTCTPQVLQIFLHLFRSPTEAKKSSSVIAWRRAAFSPCRLAPWVSSCKGGRDSSDAAAARLAFFSRESSGSMGGGSQNVFGGKAIDVLVRGS